MTSQKLSSKTVFILNVALGRQQSRGLISTINKWISSSGIEWTVSRLKAIRTAALQVRAGNLSMAREIYQTNSISYRKGLIPRGPFGPVVWRFVNAKHATSLKVSSLVLRIYTGLVLKDLSRLQYDKANKAINTPYQGDDANLEKLSRLTVMGARKLKLHSVKAPRPNISRLQAYTSTFVEAIGTLEYQWFEVSRECRDIPYGVFVTSLTTSCCLPTSLQGVNPAEDYRQFLISSGASTKHIGRIGFLQEPGAKARVVAIPNAWCQWLFEPLHTSLEKVCRNIPTSCMHDQNKGAEFIREHLGKTRMYCFDLSSATDRYPLSPQLALLKELQLNKYAEAFKEIASLPWEVETLEGDFTNWRYACGQPMGLYGSFPLFHLSHICLIEGLISTLEKKGVEVPPQSYCVLGDDVLISHPKLAGLYETVMRQWACVELSPQKTLQSDDVAEFAGFLGLRTKKSSVVFRPYKFGVKNQIANGLSLVHALGHRFIKTRTPYWCRRAAEFDRTLYWRNPDLTPLFQIKSDEASGKMPPLMDANRLAPMLRMEYDRQLDPEGNSGFFLGPMLYDMHIETACTLLDKERELCDSDRGPEQLLNDCKRSAIEQVNQIRCQLSLDPLMTPFGQGFLNEIKETNEFGSPSLIPDGE